MSIYASWLDIDDTEHERTCDVYERIGTAPSWPEGAALSTEGEDGETIYYRRVDKPCTCNNPAPIIYQGSHINPADDHPRGGSVDIAAIPNHCHPDVRGSGEDDTRFPVEFLRLSVGEDETTYHGGNPGYATVVFDRAQVEKIRDTLTAWLDAKERW